MNKKQSLFIEATIEAAPIKPRDKEIIGQLLGLFGQPIKTKTELSRQFNISPTRVKQLEQRASAVILRELCGVKNNRIKVR
jgi:DNA-directed RNA polymerase sigma subunit (sigma70/sigma32)